MFDFLNSSIDILLSISQNIGYGGIVFLMTIESLFLPFPSEIVIPPAAYLAQQGDMNIFLVILSGIIGSLIGAIINYYIAFSLGRAIIYKIADYKFFNFFLVNSKKIEKAEKIFLRYGKVSTMFGRLVPVVRQFISLPAGFSKMNFKSFVLYTAIGSTAWVTILAILGYAFGYNQQLLFFYYSEACLLLTAISLIFVLIIIIKRRKRKFRLF